MIEERRGLRSRVRVTRTGRVGVVVRYWTPYDVCNVSRFEVEFEDGEKRIYCGCALEELVA